MYASACERERETTNFGLARFYLEKERERREEKQTPMTLSKGK